MKNVATPPAVVAQDVTAAAAVSAAGDALDVVAAGPDARDGVDVSAVSTVSIYAMSSNTSAYCICP